MIEKDDDTDRSIAIQKLPELRPLSLDKSVRSNLLGEFFKLRKTAITLHQFTPYQLNELYKLSDPEIIDPLKKLAQIVINKRGDVYGNPDVDKYLFSVSYLEYLKWFKRLKIPDADSESLLQLSVEDQIAMREEWISLNNQLDQLTGDPKNCNYEGKPLYNHGLLEYKEIESQIYSLERLYMIMGIENRLLGQDSGRSLKHLPVRTHSPFGSVYKKH